MEQLVCMKKLNVKEIEKIQLEDAKEMARLSISSQGTISWSAESTERRDAHLQTRKVS